MARTNYADVVDGFTTSLTQSEVEAAINDVNLIVTNNLAGLGLSSATLETIEKYLARGQVELTENRLKREKLDDTEEERDPDAWKQWWELAAQLDTTGTLRDLQNPRYRRARYAIPRGYADV